MCFSSQPSAAILLSDIILQIILSQFDPNLLKIFVKNKLPDSFLLTFY